MDTTLLLLPQFLSPAECRALIDLAETRGFEPAPISVGHGFVMAPDIRSNTRVIADDVDLARRLWSRLAPELPARAGLAPAGLNERFRFYRYDPGQCFRWHHDGSFQRDAHERSYLTFMVYLNDGFEGGATEFDDVGPDRVIPERGLGLVFAHALRHQGAPVARGRKYVLRSDVMYRTAGAGS